MGKSGLVMNTWRQRFKSVNGTPPLYSLDFMNKLQTVVTDCQRYCDLCYSAEMIVKTIGSEKSESKRKKAAELFFEDC